MYIYKKLKSVDWAYHEEEKHSKEDKGKCWQHKLLTEERQKKNTKPMENQ